MRENRTSGSESGDWKRDRGAGLRPEAKATETPPDPIVNAPVLDSTEERRRATTGSEEVREGCAEGREGVWLLAPMLTITPPLSGKSDVVG